MMLHLQPDQYQTYPTQAALPSIWDHMATALQQSLYRVSSLLISILPGLLAFILALALMTAFGMLLSWVLRRALAAARFDERLSSAQSGGQTSGHSSIQSSVADWSPNHSPTALVGRVAFWGCVLLGLVIGVSAFEASYSSVTTLSLSLVPYLTRAVGALLILFVGNLVAQFLARTVLIGAVNNQLQYARFLSMGVKWLVLVLTAAMTLDHLQIGGNIVELAFGILFGGIVLTLSLAIGLGSRDLVSRSLERTADLAANRPDLPGFAATVSRRTPEEPLRHF